MSEVVNYRDVIDCPYAQKHWVSPKDVNKEILYEEGTFPRAFCISLCEWCICKFDYRNCMIYEKAGEQCGSAFLSLRNAQNAIMIRLEVFAMNTKRLCAFLLCAALLVSLLPAVAPQAHAEEKIPEGYIAISTPEELFLARNDLSANYILTKDIDLTEALAEGGSLYQKDWGWIAIGNGSEFTGIFDGNGHSISGLWGSCLIRNNYGTIRNLSITSGSISDDGSICDINYGTIENCKNAASVSDIFGGNVWCSRNFLGGITGRNFGAIIGCENTGDVTLYGPVAYYTFVGGIAGYSAGIIRNSRNFGNVRASNVYKPTSDYQALSKDPPVSAGGIVGAAAYESKISQCWNAGDVYAAVVKSDAFFSSAGGIFGTGECPVENSYNCGNITACNSASPTYAFAGGIGGRGYDYTDYYNSPSKERGYIDCVYNAGLVTTEDPESGEYSGGHVGGILGGSTDFFAYRKNYYYINTLPVSGGSSRMLSSQMMQMQASFVGFDFDNTWVMGSCEYKYPILQFAAEDQHEYTAVTTEPTCENQGYTTYTCSACGNVTENQYVPALGHNYGEWKQSVAPTCTATGKEIRTCARCSKTETRTLSALGHSYGDWVEILAPTCETKGQEKRTCSRCKEFQTREIAALGHDYGDWVETLAPSCTTVGEESRSCSVCNVVEVREKAALGHSYGEWIEKTAPNCTTAGEEYRVCGVCGVCETRSIEALGHTYLSKVTAPTCLKQGFTTYTCSCGDSYIADFVLPLGHNYVFSVTAAPTSSASGTLTGICTRCGEMTTVSMPALNTDDYTYSVVLAPTCVENGTGRYTWKNFDYGVFRFDVVIVATAHSYKTVIVEPTCKEKGYTVYTCSCGDTYTSDYTDALGHISVTDSEVAATCTDTGLTEGSHCSRCDEILVAQETVPALGHSYGSWSETIAPDCSSAGEKRRDCSRCDAYETQTLEALGHMVVADAAVEATCTQTGLTEGSHCSRCNTILVEQEITPALGHNYIKGVCTRCGDVIADAQTYYLTNELCDGDRVIIFNEEFGVAMSAETVESNYKAGVAVVPEDGIIDTDNLAIVWTVKETDGGYYLIDHNGNYLATSIDNSLPIDGEYKIWNTSEAKSTGCVYLRNDRGYFLEWYEKFNDFTVYTYRSSDEGRYALQIYASQVKCVHAYDVIVTQPTCTQQGYTTSTCNLCGGSYIDDTTEALGHDWDNGTVTLPPTATEDGILSYCCTRCGETDTEIIPATGEEDKPCNGGEACPSNHFTDVEGAGHWTHEGIDFAVSHGLFSGMSATTFEPDTAMTRSMLVTVLWRYADMPIEGTNSYTDVPNGTWYTDAVSWAAYNGVVTGVGNNKFDPDGKITREQMATILYRYAKSSGIDTSNRTDLRSFPDAERISSYAKEAMQWAVAEGLINGSDGKLLPQGNATRAQVAAILMRFIQNVVK